MQQALVRLMALARLMALEHRIRIIHRHNQKNHLWKKYNTTPALQNTGGFLLL